MGTLGVLHFMLFDCPVNSITRLTAMHRSQPLFQHIVQLFDQACEEARNKSDQFEKAGYPRLTRLTSGPTPDWDTGVSPVVLI